MSKAERMGRAGHIACMRGRKIPRVFCWKHMQERYYLEDIVRDGKIIFKRIIK